MYSCGLVRVHRLHQDQPLRTVSSDSDLSRVSVGLGYLFQRSVRASLAAWAVLVVRLTCGPTLGEY